MGHLDICFSPQAVSDDFQLSVETIDLLQGSPLKGGAWFRNQSIDAEGNFAKTTGALGRLEHSVFDSSCQLNDRLDIVIGLRWNPDEEVEPEIEEIVCEKDFNSPENVFFGNTLVE